jgi:hypothetical protein
LPTAAPIPMALQVHSSNTWSFFIFSDMYKGDEFFLSFFLFLFLTLLKDVIPRLGTATTVKDIVRS